MNADRRIIPATHILSLLAEEHIAERTREVSHRLGNSSHRLHHVANEWLSQDGINALSRVILKNVHSVPHSYRNHHRDHETPSSWNTHHERTIISHSNPWKGTSALNITGQVCWAVCKFLFRMMTLLVLFWPTRSFILLLLGSMLINSFWGASLPSFILALVALVVHLVSTGINRVVSGHWEEHGVHWHGGHH